MDMTILLMLILTGILTLYYCVYYRWNKTWQILRQIPGPSTWPILGNIHFLYWDPRSSWHKLFTLAQEYGPVMRLQVGNTTMVVLNSYEAIYSALVTHGKQTLTRPTVNRVELAMPKTTDIIFNKSNEQWKVLRRAFLQNFKYYGSGKSHLEPIILDVLNDLLVDLRQTNETAVDPRPIIYKYFASIVFVINFGKKPSSAESIKLVEYFSNEFIHHLDVFDNGFQIDSWDWYDWLAIGHRAVRRTLSKVVDNGLTLWETYGKPTDVNADLPPFDYDEGKIREPCFAATLKAIVAANKDKGFLEEHAIGTIKDTYIGGLTTSTISLHSFCNLMLHYPDVQDRLHTEIDSLLGDDPEALVTTHMKDTLHYLQATLYELIRFTSILPFGIPHETMTDVTIEGYVIPRGTTILTNLFALHHDDQWREPFEFQPERYLDEDGKFVSADHPSRKRQMAFGAGHRVCAGMILALNRYFLTLGNLMRQFRLERDPACDLQSCDPRLPNKPGILIFGPPFTVKFIPRFCVPVGQ